VSYRVQGYFIRQINILIPKMLGICMSGGCCSGVLVRFGSQFDLMLTVKYRT